MSGLRPEHLPYGVFRHAGAARPRVGVRLRDRVLDLALLSDEGLLDEDPALFAHDPTVSMSHWWFGSMQGGGRRTPPFVVGHVASQ